MAAQDPAAKSFAPGFCKLYRMLCRVAFLLLAAILGPLLLLGLGLRKAVGQKIFVVPIQRHMRPPAYGYV
jgi:hypothetical protein